MSGARVVAELAGDGSGFERMMNRAGQQVSKFESTLSGVKNTIAGLFALGAIEEGVRGIINYAAHIRDLHEQTGLATDEVQRIGYAAEASGLQFEDFQTALSKMGSARKEAAESNDKLLRSFERFGVTMADIQNPALRNVDILYKMAAAIKDVNLNAGQRQELREFFGRSGDKLAESIANLDKFKDRAIISSADIDAIDRFEKAISKLISTAKVLAAPTIAGAADALSGAVNLASEKPFLDQVVAFLKVNKGGDKHGAAMALDYFNALKYNFSPESTANIKSGLLGYLATQPKSVTPGQGFIGALFGQQNAPIKNPGFQGPKKPEQFGPPNPTQGQFASMAGGGTTLYVDERKIALLEQQRRLTELAYQNSLKLLTPEERRASLIKEINNLLFAANVLRATGNEKGANDLLIAREEMIGKVEDIKQPKIPNDSLTRVGNFLGSGAANIPSIQSRITQDNTIALHAVARGVKELGRVLKMITGNNPYANPNGAPP